MSEEGQKADMPPSSLRNVVKFGQHTVTTHSTSVPSCLATSLVCSHRIVPHLSDLSTAEVTDLYLTVQKLQRTLKRVYRATAFNVAMQDGKAAGQSVPHVHCHVIPRREGDMDDRGGGDAIYEELEGEGGNVGKHFWERDQWTKFKTDDERKDRSEEVMKEEAEMLAREIEKDEQQS